MDSLLLSQGIRRAEMEYFAFIAQEMRNGRGKQPAAWEASKITEKWKNLKIYIFLESTGFSRTVLKSTVYTQLVLRPLRIV